MYVKNVILSGKSRKNTRHIIRNHERNGSHVIYLSGTDLQK